MGNCCSSDYWASVTTGAPTDLMPDLQPVKQLGRGASANAGVWLCKDNRTGDMFAVKLLRRGFSPGQARLVTDEVLIQARLGPGHVSIVRPRELILTRRHLGFAMEWVGGGTLESLIRANARQAQVPPVHAPLHASACERGVHAGTAPGPGSNQGSTHRPSREMPTFARPTASSNPDSNAVSTPHAGLETVDSSVSLYRAPSQATVLPAAGAPCASPAASTHAPARSGTPPRAPSGHLDKLVELDRAARAGSFGRASNPLSGTYIAGAGGIVSGRNVGEEKLREELKRLNSGSQGVPRAVKTLHRHSRSASSTPLPTYTRTFTVGLTEDLSAYLFRQFMQVLEYCMDNRVAYRDVKLDNLLVDERDPPRLKVTDFGVAKSAPATVGKSSSIGQGVPSLGQGGGSMERAANPKLIKCTTLVGTPGYLGPEMLAKLLYGGAAGTATAYDAVKHDIWAAGIVLAFMLLGENPFGFEEVKEVAGVQGALKHAFEVQSHRSWREAAGPRLQAAALSEQCMDLLDHMLQADPVKRYGVKQVLEHPWFVRRLPEKYERVLEELRLEQEQIMKHLRLGHYETAQREADVHDMVALAQQPARPEEPAAIMRIRLSVTADDYVQDLSTHHSLQKSMSYSLHKVGSLRDATAVMSKATLSTMGGAVNKLMATPSLKSGVGPLSKKVSADGSGPGSTSQDPEHAAAGGGSGHNAGLYVRFISSAKSVEKELPIHLSAPQPPDSRLESQGSAGSSGSRTQGHKSERSSQAGAGSTSPARLSTPAGQPAAPPSTVGARGWKPPNAQATSSSSGARGPSGNGALEEGSGASGGLYGSSPTGRPPPKGSKHLVVHKFPAGLVSPFGAPPGAKLSALKVGMLETIPQSVYGEGSSMTGREGEADTAGNHTGAQLVRTSIAEADAEA